MKTNFAILILLMQMTMACTEENLDFIEETSCSEAEGLWTISSATCNGTLIEDFNPVSLSFLSSGRLSQTQGTPACSSTFSWDVVIGQALPSFEMTGTGNLKCSENGVEVTSCSTSTNSCHSSLDFTGISNNYSTCVIVGDKMSLTRTVTTLTNPDNLSYCSSGEMEEVTAVKGEYVPPPPVVDTDPVETQAVLSITNTDPANFGTISVGSRKVLTLNLLNSGEGAADNMEFSGLAMPFYFNGGSFPGNGGSCTDSLPAGETCSLVLEFFPMGVGIFTDTLQVNYHDGQVTRSFSHGTVGRGSNSLGLLQVSNGPFYDFGNLPVGQTTSFLITVVNTGGGGVSQISEIGLAPPFNFTGGIYPGTGGSCGVTLATSASCTLEIGFSPSAQGSFNDALILRYNDGASDQQVKRNLFGSGT